MAEENQKQSSDSEKQVDFGYRAVPESEKEEDVKEVFESVAKRYDLMNDVLSFGLHRVWKRTCVSLSGAAEGQKVLDIASGTCDMAIRFGEVVGKSGEVWATDINHEMIKEGTKRLKAVGCKAHVAICDCEALPFEDNYFDIAVVSFGLRNMTHKDRALKEMMRVVRPGGRVVVLEFSRCWKIFKPFYDSVFLQAHAVARAKDRGRRGKLPVSGRVHPHASRSADACRASWKRWGSIV